MNNTNVKKEAIAMIPIADQLTISRSLGHFPNYIEPTIDFLPSYKMSSEIDTYINKKNQAPSYTDRVLYKNNSSNVVEQNYYKCLHNVFGSDHRPVQLSLTIKDFKQPDFADL